MIFRTKLEKIKKSQSDDKGNDGIPRRSYLWKKEFSKQWSAAEK